MSLLNHPDAFKLSPEERCSQLERQLARERQIRINAEAIAERGLREAYLTNQRFALLCDIANAANESIDPLETLRFAISEICTAIGAAFANVLLRQNCDGDVRLEACGIWHALNPDQLFAFAERSSRIVAWPCASAPGRLLVDRTTLWTRDIHAYAGSARNAEAKACNLRSSISAPVLQGDEVVAVMEFFSHDATEPDPQLLETLYQIGVQIGRVFKRQANADKLLRNAMHDPLTDLPNRALFEKKLREAFCRETDTEAPHMSLIYIDLDGFKLVNDALGHLAGDQLLVAMTERLRQQVETYSGTADSDVGRGIFIARMGGDEFTILVEGEKHREMACEIASKIHWCLETSYFIGTNEVRCAASVGIAHSDGQYLSPADLMRDADVAMYDAKVRGTGRTSVFDQNMRNTALARLQLEAELRTALETHAFRLHYQPIIDISKGQLVGFEALLRWQRGSELAMPNEFLPVAEETGLMNVIGAWVLREACQTAAKWSRSCPAAPPFYVSVNVAPCQLLQPNFSEQVRDIVLATDVDPSLLVIELTENAAITNHKRTARILNDLRAMGIRLSLDDFGTGYSSLSHLQTLPFDSIKIDRSFLTDEKSNVSWSIINAILSVAGAMKVNVIAEGIETESQLDRLADIGCAFGQGFLYDRAITADAAFGMLCAPAIYTTPRAQN